MENSKEKNPSKEGKQMHAETEHKEDRCGKDCGCGDCHCHCGDDCCCCRKKVCLKILGCLLLFLAGMGFSELLSCGRCPLKSRPLPPVAPMAAAPMPAHDFMPVPGEQGNTVIIINTDGSVDKFAGKPGCGCKGECKCGEKGGCMDKAPRPHFDGKMPQHDGKPHVGDMARPNMPKPDMPKSGMEPKGAPLNPVK